MTQFAQKSFSVALGLNEQGRKNYERIFGKKPDKVYIEKNPPHRILPSKAKKAAK